jgi:predicted alpha/beta superfamily hydrolase
MSALNSKYDTALLPRIDLIGQEYEIPVLGKHRRVAVMLPHNYDSDPDKRYPVLYLQDGQNLYEDEAPFGTWAVDKRLALLAAEGFGDVIVVAIDHAEQYRIKEFSPFLHPKLGQGEGDLYINFIVEELKPFIDSRYRTLPTRENTGIGGSSMGGLISIYAGFLRPDVYGKLMIFSPSLWVSDQIFNYARHYLPYQTTRIYLYGGEQEGRGSDIGNFMKMMHGMKEELEQVSLRHPKTIEIMFSSNPVGKHSEYYWGVEFPKALKWLYFKQDVKEGASKPIDANHVADKSHEEGTGIIE